VSFIHTHKRSAVDTAGTARLGAALPDPIPTKIPHSGLTLTLQEVLQAPATSQKIPLTRIHQMRVLTSGKKDRHFIQELRGYIYEIENKQLRVFMDIRRERPGFISEPGLATGFGSFAFHPEFYKNGLLYTTHTEAANTAPADFAYADTLRVTLQWVLTEWKMKDPGARTFAGTGREMMRVNMMTQMHGVQEITFNPLARPGSPDYGLLYIGIGDGGAAERGAYFICDSNKTVWSSVLRIDPQGRNSKNGQYGIPAINPYARDNDPNTLGEVFARGFRNPNRITWAPDGQMLISDIGLTKVEELNIGTPGADYGWPAREGTFLLHFKGKMDRVYALPEDDQKFNFTYPVAQFDHDEGNAFSGGFVYQGPDMPLLKGKYVFGDIVSGRVFFVKTDQLKIGQQSPIQELKLSLGGKVITLRQTTANKKTDLRFGLGPKQELYLFTKTDGRIYQVVNCSAEKE
jgi:glucose/arabinose dehydrogenase